LCVVLPLWRVLPVAMIRQRRRSALQTVTLCQSVTPFRVPLLWMKSCAPFLKFSSATGC
jgi:hypothetical protein